MRVALIENTAITHHGQVGVALHEAAAQVEIFRPWLDGVLPEPGDHDAMVAFGGGQSALSDDSHGYLADLARVMAQTAATDRAVLGICLGAQVMARGLGAQNLIGTATEVGWHMVTKTAAAADDPVLRHLPDAFPIFEWHEDTFTLPPNVLHLASSPVAPAQCYRAHRAAYGMQFHFEASRAVVTDWTAHFPDLLEAHIPGWVADFPTHAATHGTAADQHGLAIARAWVALI